MVRLRLARRLPFRLGIRIREWREAHSLPAPIPLLAMNGRQRFASTSPAPRNVGVGGDACGLPVPGFNTGVTAMKFRSMVMCATVLGLLSAGANAQSRGEGWEFGADLLYQNSQDVDFDGGTNVEFDSDIGISLYAGYRFSDRLEVQMGLDWSNTDYDVSFV